MRRVLFLVAVLCLLASGASAQTPCTTPVPQTTPPTYICEVGSPRTARFDPPAGFLAGDQYRLYLDNAQVGPNVPAVAGTAAVNIQFASTPVGSHTVQVSTYRSTAAPGSQETKSTPVTLQSVNVPPGSPGNLQIVMQLLDGQGHVLASYTLFRSPLDPAQ